MLSREQKWSLDRVMRQLNMIDREIDRGRKNPEDINQAQICLTIIRQANEAIRRELSCSEWKNER